VDYTLLCLDQYMPYTLWPPLVTMSTQQVVPCTDTSLCVAGHFCPQKMLPSDYRISAEAHLHSSRVTSPGFFAALQLDADVTIPGLR
jgi:hypothetical protein